MKKSLLFFLMALLLPVLASAANMAISKTANSYYSYGYGTKTENRLGIPCEAAGFSSPMDGSESYTISAWLKPTEVTTTTGVVLALNPQVHMNPNGNWVVTTNSSGVLSIAGHGGATDHGAQTVGIKGTTTGKINIGEWNYVTVTVDNENLKFCIYVDGQLQVEKTMTDKLYFPSNLQNGGDGPAWFHVAGAGLSALIDEVHAFNKALSADEVAQAFTNPKKMDSLTGFFTFDEESDETGYFDNLAANAPANSSAVYWLWRTNQADWISGTNSATSATLVEGRVTSFTFTAPSASDYEHLDELLFMLGETAVEAGQTVEEIEPETELTMQAFVAAGYVIAGVSVNGVAQTVNDMGDEVYYVQFPVTSDLDKDSFVFTITRTPYELTFTAPEQGSLTLKDGETVLESGAMVPAGTVITVETTAPDGQYAIVTVNGNAVSGNSFEMPEEAAVVVITFADIDYCTPSGKTVNGNQRGINTITVNGTEINGGGTARNRDIYFDRTETVIDVTAGESLEFSTAGSGIWIHTYIFGDFDKNGWTVDTSIPGLNGDLLWFNLLSNNSSVEDPLYDMEGNTVAGDARSKDVNLNASVQIPLDLAPGVYRMRYMTAWAAADPCGVMTVGGANNSLSGVGGTVVDFMINVISPYLEAERTITIASSDEEAGTVEFIQPASTEKSISTALKSVIVKATPSVGAEFLGWYKSDQKLSDDPEYVITDTEDLSIQANFIWSEQYTVTFDQPENGTLEVLEGEQALESGASVLANTTLTLKATPAAGYHFVNFVVNDQETTETSISVRENLTVSAVFEEGVEYCELQGTKTNGRYVSALEVNNGMSSQTVNVGTQGYTKVYVDLTDTKVVAEPGNTVTITSSGSGSWMHSYLFVDFDRNGWNVDEDINEPNGDLVWYNAYSLDETNYKDSDGNTFTTRGDAHNKPINGVKATFTVPANLEPGEYRVRYKVDWNCTNPCGRFASLGYTGSIITGTNGNIIDFTLVVEKAELDHERTVSVAVAEGQDELGSVAIDGVEGNSVTTNAKYVGLTATATAEGAKFLSWNKADEVASTEAKYVAKDTEDAAYVAHFGWNLTYSAGEGGALQVKDAEGNVIASDSYLEPGTVLTAVVTPDQYKELRSLTINGEKVEVTENKAEFTIEGVTTLEAQFKNEDYDCNITVTGNGEVQVWTAFNDDDDAPAGEQILNGQGVELHSEVAIFIMPGKNNSGVENIMAISILNGSEPEITLEDLETYGWQCGYDDNNWVIPQDIEGSLNINVTFSEDFAGIGDILFDGIEGETEYYNLNGVRVAAENLETGIYIARRGNKAVKVYIRK